MLQALQSPDDIRGLFALLCGVAAVGVTKWLTRPVKVDDAPEGPYDRTELARWTR